MNISMKIANAVFNGMVAESEEEAIQHIATIVSGILNDAEPVAYLVERHVFRASQDGQDAEGLDWLEVAEIGDAGSFPVYAAPPAAEINRQLLDALKRAKWIIDMYAQVAWHLNGNEAIKTLIDDAISAAERSK